MPIMPGKYPPSKQQLQQQQSEVIFEHDTVETESQDGLVILEPSSLKVLHEDTSPVLNSEPPSDPYNLDHYLVTSSEGFSPFEQNLGTTPFEDQHGDPVWAALAYTEEGGVHPGKAAPHLSSPIRIPLGGEEYHLPSYSAYSILLPNPDVMEYVPLDDDDSIPQGRTPVPAGCENDGLRKLYFATASVPRTFLDGLFGNRGEDGMIVVPGKWGQHLGGVHVAYGEREVVVKEGGKVLCWKKK